MSNTDAEIRRLIRLARKKTPEKTEEDVPPSEDNEDGKTAIQIYYDHLTKLSGDRATGITRDIANGLFLGWGQELESKLYNDSDAAYKKIQEEQSRYSTMNPKASFATEGIAGVASGVGVAAGLGKAGVRKASNQIAIETAIVGAGSGETNEERALYALLFGAGGKIAGKVIDKFTSPEIPSAPTASKELTVTDDTAAAFNEAQARGTVDDAPEGPFTPIKRLPPFTPIRRTQAEASPEVAPSMPDAQALAQEAQSAEIYKQLSENENLVNSMAFPNGRKGENFNEFEYGPDDIADQLGRLAEDISNGNTIEVPANVADQLRKSGFVERQDVVVTRTNGETISSATVKLKNPNPTIPEQASPVGFGARIEEPPKARSYEEDPLNRRSYEEDVETWSNSSRQNQNAPGWREATNAGEFVDGLKNSIVRFYEDNLVGMSDRLGRRVSKEVGGRVQRADEAALKVSAREVEEFVDPVEPTAQLWTNDEAFARMLLNYSAGRRSRKDIISYVNEKLGTEQAGAFSKYLAWSDRKNAEHQFKISGKKYIARDYLATKITQSKKAEINKSAIEKRAKEDGVSLNRAKQLIEEESEMTLPLDTADYSLKRGDAENPRDNVNIRDYDNPILSNTRRIINNERLVQYADKFGVSANGRNLTPETLMDAVRDSMIKKGINPEAAEFARQAIVENIIGQGKSPNGWIQALQSIGYAGSLAGPKSALLNIHDIPQTVVTQGKGSLRGIQGMDLSRFGMTNQNFGEFQNRLNDSFAAGSGWEQKAANYSRKATDTLMKASGFKLMDQYGKKGVTSMVLRRNVDDVMSGKGLKEEWGFYFNDAEIRSMEKAIKQHGMDFEKYTDKGGKLVEELVMAGLGQQQLISGAGRPAGWARNPNLRPLWALRGFAIKQQALAYKNIVENIQDGNTDAAVKWAGQYMLWAAGTYGAVNEGRQAIFGDGDASFEGFLRGVADQVAGITTLNTLGFNDYQLGRMKKNGVISTALEGAIPIAIDVPIDLVGKTYQAVKGERDPLDILPLTKQLKSAAENTGMLTGS